MSVEARTYEAEIEKLAREVPMAPEEALKLKEISYIHAEGCAAGELKHGPIALATATMPALDATVAPIVYAAPIQQPAYHTAFFMGKDVDQPRNLAKSVTVE